MLEVRHGVVDIGLVTPIYLRAGAHMLRTQAGFYGGSRGYDDQLAVYRCLSRRSFRISRTRHAGLKVFAVQGGNLPGRPHALEAGDRRWRTSAAFVCVRRWS